MVFLSSGDGYGGELLELPQGCQGPFRGSRGKVGLLSRRRSEKEPHLTLRGESPAFSQVMAANLGSLSSYDGDLRDPLVGASGTSSLHASCEGPPRIPLYLLPGLRSSSGVEARTSGFLSRAYMDLRVPLGITQVSQASSRVETCTSDHLSSWKRSFRIPLGLT